MKVSRSSSRSSSPPCGRREAQAATGRAGDLRAAQWSLLATMPARGPAAHSTGLWLWVEDREGGALVLPLQLCVSPHFLPKAYGGFDASHHSHSHDRRLNNQKPYFGLCSPNSTNPLIFPISSLLDLHPISTTVSLSGDDSSQFLTTPLICQLSSRRWAHLCTACFMRWPRWLSTARLNGIPRRAKNTQKRRVALQGWGCGESIEEDSSPGSSPFPAHATQLPGFCSHSAEVGS